MRSPANVTDPGGAVVRPAAAWGTRDDPETWFRDEPPVTEPAKEEPSTKAEGYPQVYGYSTANLEYDTTLGDDFDDTLANVNTDLVWEFTPTHFMTTDIRLILDGEDDGLRTYNTDLPFQGVYIRRLKFQKETDDYAIFGGKFEPGRYIFGYAPIYFGNFSTDLNLEERVGVGGALILDREENSEVRLTAQAFYLDTSRLSGELFSGKARDGITEGQVGDTGRLDNYLVTLNGGVTGWDPGLRYTVGAGRQRPGSAVERTENALLASVYEIHPLSDGGDLEFSVDLLSLENAGGFNQDSRSVTFGGGFSEWPDYAGLAYSVRKVDDHQWGETRRDRIIEVVLRKGITDSTLIEAAYQYADTWNEIERNVGVLVQYYKDWKL